MPQAKLTAEMLTKTVATMAKHATVSGAARELGISRATLHHRMKEAEAREIHAVSPVTYPIHPDDDLPVDQLIELAAKRFEKRKAAFLSRQRQPIRIASSEPCVISFVGDPHLDDDGTDWPRLLADIELMKRPGVYAVNVGDTTNNWTGRLMRLYADQDTSRGTARKYAKWLLTESGVTWLAWILGNHDEWESGSAILRLMNADKIVMEDWTARLDVEFGNGSVLPIWVSHDFVGHSQWNRMHGLMKAAMMRGGAAVYACGHRHTAGLHWEPLEDQNASYWALRSRGYKFIDKHAIRLGYGGTDEGHTTAVVIDPRKADLRDALQGFKSLEAAVAYRDAIAKRAT